MPQMKIFYIELLFIHIHKSVPKDDKGVMVNTTKEIHLISYIISYHMSSV